MVLGRVFKIAAYVLSALAGVVVAMANTQPSEAASNLKAWVDLFGIGGVGDAWTGATDSRVMHIAVATLTILSALLIWDFVWKRRAARVRRAPVPIQPTPTAPVPTTWISPAQASAITAKSSLILMHVPNDVTVGHLFGRALGDTSRTPGEVKTAELTRKRLRDFATQHPGGVCNGQYGKELLEWWIDEQAALDK